MLQAHAAPQDTTLFSHFTVARHLSKPFCCGRAAPAEGISTDDVKFIDPVADSGPQPPNKSWNGDMLATNDLPDLPWVMSAIEAKTKALRISQLLWWDASIRNGHRRQRLTVVKDRSGKFQRSDSTCQKSMFKSPCLLHGSSLDALWMDSAMSPWHSVSPPNWHKGMINLVVKCTWRKPCDLDSVNRNIHIIYFLFVYDAIYTIYLNIVASCKCLHTMEQHSLIQPPHC